MRIVNEGRHYDTFRYKIIICVIKHHIFTLEVHTFSHVDDMITAVETQPTVAFFVHHSARNQPFVLVEDDAPSFASALSASHNRYAS